MSDFVFSLLVIMVIVSYGAIFNLVKENRLIFIVFITIIWVGTGFFSWTYYTHSYFRNYIETIFSPDQFHVVIGSENMSLPLPPNTALAFRSSNEGAGYFTRLTDSEVMQFYNNLSETNPIAEYSSSSGNSNFQIFFNRNLFDIAITSNRRFGTYFHIKLFDRPKQ